MSLERSKRGEVAGRRQEGHWVPSQEWMDLDWTPTVIQRLFKAAKTVQLEPWTIQLIGLKWAP